MKIRVGIAQFAPVVLDLKRSVEKAVDIIKSASKKNVQLLAFPETWIPVYPVWADMGTYSQWDNEAGKKLYARLLKNSLSVPSPELTAIASACKKSKTHVMLGVNERVGKSIFNSLLFINPKGELIGHHRKLVPTHGERLVWAHGDGEGLRAHETSFGKVGGLICWEHWMPPARQVLHEQGETIHVAAWPHGKERHQIASRHYAFEGRCFVLAAAMILKKKMFPRDYELREELASQPEVLLDGGSAIIGPDGNYIVEPVYGKETLIVADIDTNRALEESLTLDVAGHYSRPDVFELKVHRRRHSGT
ncbi:MAG: carbon-nitrogen hydrolase family protein [Ignavibacteria bacterium]|nr:carbon-nitrogen hydrolase family protein [Ignavibacteria bacterium]